MANILDRNLGRSAVELSLEYIYPPCAGKTNYQAFATRTIRRGAEQYYDGPEHRPFPANLLASLTHRGSLRKYVENYQLYKRVQAYTWGAPKCVPPATYYRVDHYRRPPGTHPGFVDDLDDAAYVDLRLRIKDSRQNLAEYVGEAWETFDMFSRAGEKVVDTIRKVRDSAGTQKRYKRPKGGWFRIPRNWRRWIRKIPATWLVSAFVLSPTLSDAAEAYERAQTWSTRPLKRRIVVTKRKLVDVSVPGAGDGECSHTGVLSKRFIVYVTYSPTVRDSDTTFGNPLEAVYAGVPFSWVLDYFSNVGDFLSSLDAMTGVTSVTGTRTTLESRRTWDTAVGVGQALEEPGVYNYSRYERSVLYSIPVGGVNWKPSGSWRRLTNLSAVLASFRL